jgi:glucan 1,3-beta-glucosidase
MDDDLFATNAGAAKDHWNFDLTLGTSKGATVLTQHFNKWLTEDDVQTLATFGINHLRVPLGYWTFMPAISGEPWVQANQTAQLDRIIGYATARNMSVLIDLHSMPGLQGGWQSGGRETGNENVHFYDDDMQTNNDAAIKAVLQYIYKQPQRDTISGIGIVSALVVGQSCRALMIRQMNRP